MGTQIIFEMGSSKKSDMDASRPNDQGSQRPRSDHSATMKDIELDLLRKLLKDGGGAAQDSSAPLRDSLQEIHSRNRRNLLTLVAVVFLVIGMLSFIGYNQLASLKDRAFEMHQEISVIEDTLHRIVSSGECTLTGTSSYGKIVFYPKDEPKTYQADERVCALSVTYPWTCEKEALRNYVGKKVLLAISGFEQQLDFTVIGFFAPRDQTRMIQIPMHSLETVLGSEKAYEYIDKGVLDGEIMFRE
jgi:hypothetical protein